MNNIIGRSKNKGFKIFFLLILFMLFIYGYFRFEKHLEYEANKVVGIEPNNEIEECTCSKSYNIPIYIIDTLGKEIPMDTRLEEKEINGVKYNFNKKSEKIDAILKQYLPNENGYTCICGILEPSIESNISINVRGQSSLLNPKKQYTVRFVDEDGNKKDVDLGGMGSHDKWVFNGAYLDRTGLRNYLASKMGQIMEYTPQAEFAEVFLHKGKDNVINEEDYIGLYLVTEKIERGKSRIDIQRSDDRFKDISFIVARDKIKYEDHILNTNWGKLEDDYMLDKEGRIRFKTVFTAVYPSASNLTNEYKNRIIDYLNAFEYTLHSNFFMDKKKGYRKYIDVDSFVQFAMINEVFKNIDGGDVSTYFYKDVGGLMKAGPIWDFDQTLGNTSDIEVNEPTGFRTVNTLWFERLFQDPLFAQRYQELYKEYRLGAWSDESIDNIIDEALEYLGSAIIRNEERWYARKTISYESDLEKMREFIHNRLKWMDENIDLVKRSLENN